MQDLRDCFREHPIIASIRNNTDFTYALNSKAAALFILHGDIFNLPQIMKEGKKRNKLVFLHIDLIKGIGRDRANCYSATFFARLRCFKDRGTNIKT
jgi:glycerol uptake operon antiterminator